MTARCFAAIATPLLLLAAAPARKAAAQDWVPRQTAELQVLDKVTARISVLKADVGQAARYGTLTILVRACNARPPDEVPDAAAGDFLQLWPHRHGTDAMFAAYLRIG